MADFAKSDSPPVQAQLDRLATLSPGHDQLGLERISQLLERLGRPQDSLPPIFHVAGTNGKGSTCAFLRSMLEAAGLKVHVFTSPHLVRFNERIRVAGELVDDEVLAGLLEEVLDAAKGIAPSFFEVTTAAAFLAFQRTSADACVLEVGLGGRLDATNVVERPAACGIAGLGMDHSQWLGRTLRGVAREKAGIAKLGVPLVTQRYPAELAGEVAATAQAAGARLVARPRDWTMRVAGGRIDYRDKHGALALPVPGMAGRHQADNAALAVAMLRHQQAVAVGPEAIAAGIEDANWPARLQRLSPGPLLDLLPRGSELWLDGAHNGSASRRIASHVRREFDAGKLPLVMLVASLKTKNPALMLRPFADLTRHVHAVPIADHDSRPPEEIAGLAGQLGFEATANATLAEALQRVTAPSRVLILGSLYLAGEALRANREFPA